MDNTKVHDVIIIGSGPAGLTAAIYCCRAFMHPIVIEGDNPGGQLMGTTAVENWPGTASIMGPKLMMDMQKQAKLLGTTFISESAIEVNFSKQPFTITTPKTTLQSHTVIIATGACPNRLKCPGENTYWGKGVTVCAVCDGAFYPHKKVVILGGGDTAMEDASFMSKYTSDITIIHIKDEFTASPAMQKRIFDLPHIKIIYNSTVSEIKGNGSHITELIITDILTQKKSTLPADALFLAIGQKPNISLFKGQLDLDHMGYIKLINHTNTSVSGVFCAGDVADYRYRQAVVSAGSGCMAALDAQRYLENKEKMGS